MNDSSPILSTTNYRIQLLIQVFESRNGDEKSTFSISQLLFGGKEWDGAMVPGAALSS